MPDPMIAKRGRLVVETANALGALRAEVEAELQKATPATKQKASNKRAAKKTTKATGTRRKSKSA